MGKKQKKSGDDSAKDDGVDIDALAAEIEGAGASKEPKGKKKKKGVKKDEFDEDDILKELEELSLETQGVKAKAAAPPIAPPSNSDEDSVSRSRVKAKDGKKGGKQASGSDGEEDRDEDEGLKKKGGGGGKEEEEGSEAEEREAAFGRDRKKKIRGKAVKMESEDEEEQDGEDGASGFKMKTAAQKKAEKKERDRKKKEEERMKQRKLKEKEKEGSVEPEKKTAEVPPPQEDPPIAAAEEQEGAEPEEEMDGDKKKKDKKKKKGEKEKEEKKKGPSKATVKAMQEALAKMKEEEEQAKREEEERLRRLEEMEKQREEQERLELERKEKKKQKEKERKERLKKEGKLLTKTQKEARARAEATLKLLQAQGVEVPSRDSLPKKKPVYGDKRKKKQPNAPTPEETSEVMSPTTETLEPVAMETEVVTPAAAPEVKPEAAVDDWEAIATDEEKEMKKVHIEVKEEMAAAPRPAGSEEDDEEEEEDDDDDEEEDDDDGGDEEESEEEAEKQAAPAAALGTQGAKRRAAKESEDESTESDDDDGRTKDERRYDRAKRRIEKRKAENMRNIDLDRLRAPVVCVLGHVDTGKTKILDKLRHTHVQDGEAGGITQQIGATNVPKETIEEQTKMVKNFDKDNLRIPGMLIIDTPGHESFSNLRNRGSSLCDIAILVVDIMHGLEPQTLESINLLKEKKCPFIVALNKVDRLYDWKKSPETDIVTTLKKQKKNTKDEFDERAKAVIVEFAQQGLNAALFHENKDPRTFVSLVPTSAHSGDGMGNLIALLVELTQTMLARRLAHCDELRAQVMEVKALPGMGTTIDVILINGCLREGETIIVPGVEGPIVTQIRGLLLPPPLKELRVKTQYEKHKEVSTSQGVKILGKDLEKTLAGLPLLVAHREDEIPVLRDELERELKQTLSCIKLEEKGVYVQASTLGSLEALLEFLRTSKVPYAGINIGPVHKKDVMKASTMLEHDVQYAVILAFDVKVERESQEMADSLGVRIFSAEIIYHLFDSFTKYREDYKKAKQDEYKNIAVFPVKLRILPQFIFNSRDPIVMGVTVEAGVLRQGTPLCVPTKGFVDIGIVTSIEMNHKSVDSAKKGQEICIKIEPIPGESPKMYGRHFEATDLMVSKITRASIDALKNWFRDDMQKTDWQLIMELKKTFEII
ncbi:eukaryotic translation initiation factor 5B isoform X1 [Sander lucioperca]|uniref:eukaryotic translation initiation factor 5B isoform X1 n=1 Tax=Sander lucioperca TaxID=283035 RepID=UPI00125CF28B|nr:eukaryotic translation initiation factor 5B isoform X1 [Sander lucioperca]XP_035854252.1 eukaryotic translation initiation factor 5B isoform X1 [Sander lucioperca]XP_035854253.1 eukaryotic translation initiation factor 5B isoform X1 [Sander lucioperca]